MIGMEIGHIISQLRHEKNISQKQLANDLNVSFGLVGLWETNKRIPSLESFISLIDYFSISADFFLEKDRKLKPEQYMNRTVDVSMETKKILDTFQLLNEDNQDILIGEAKKLLKTQHIEEKRKVVSVAKAT